MQSNLNVFSLAGSGQALSPGSSPTFTNLTITGTLTLDTATVLPSGSTATTQAALDNSTDVATDAYVDRIAYLPTWVGFRDDWITQVGTANFTSANSTFGDTTWADIQISGGTQTVGAVAGTWANPGQLLMTTSSTSGQGMAIYKSGHGSLGNLAAQGGWDIHIIYKLSQTTNCCIRLGVCKDTTQASDPPTDWFGVEYDTANTGNTNTDFTWVTRSASTSNYSTTNAIAADTSFHHFRIRSLVAGTVRFSVDGGTETAISTDVSTAIMLPFFQLLTRTSGTALGTIDFYSYSAQTTRT